MQKKITILSLSIYLILSFICPFNGYGKSIILYPEMENYLLSQGVVLSSCHLEGSYTKLKEIFQNHKIIMGSNVYPRNHKHIETISASKKNKMLPYLEEGIQLLDNAKTVEEKKYSCYLSSRLLYAFISLSFDRKMERLEKTTNLAEFPLKNKSLKKIIKMEKKGRIGKEQAKKEASFLKTQGDWAKSELSGEELSNVDIREDDPLYQSDSNIYFNGQNGDKRVKAFYQKIGKALAQWINKNNPDSEKKIDSYAFDDSKKILFFDTIDGAKTDDKNEKLILKARDEFGVGYKINFNENKRWEVIFNYLHLALGGKFVLYKQFHSNQNPLLLIINSADESNQLDEIKLLSNSTFYSKYIIKKGEIDPHQLISFLGLRDHEWPDKAPEYKSLIGKKYFLVKNVLAQLHNHDIFHIAGATPLSNTGAHQSRSIRSLSLFHRLVGSQYLSDGSYRSGTLDRNYFSETNIYFEFPYQLEDPLVAIRPKSWRYASYSDYRWMARRIVGTFTDDTIKEAFKSGHLESSISEKYFLNLTSAREQIRKLFNISFEL